MHFTQGMTLCPQGAGKPATVPLREEMREWQADAGLRLFNVYLDFSWPHVITSDNNKPLCGENTVVAGRISGAFNELTDCHFELDFTQ